MEMSSRIIIWLLCIGAVFVAWSPHAHLNESRASTTNPRLDVDTTPTTPSPDPKQLLATTTQITKDHGVRVTLRVTNVGDHAVELDFPSGLTHDVIILDASGKQVWRWSDGRMFTQAVRNTLLGANESVAYDARWHPKGLTGTFTAVAVLKSNNHPLQQRTEFVLP